MNKMKVTLFPCSMICICVLTACSSEADRRQANRDFDYTSAVLRPQIVTPAPLTAPVVSPAYRLPAETQQGPVAENVDVRPPEQIMSFVSSSRADNSRNTTILWFSARSLSQHIDEDLWSWLISYLSINKITITHRDDVNKVLDTGPVAVTFDAENADDIPPAPAQLYQFQVKNDPVTHRAGLLIKWLKAADDQVTPTVFEQRHYATRLLNNVSAYADAQSRGQTAIASNGPIQLVLGQDGSGSQAIIAENAFVNTWQWLQTVLPKAGLPIEQSAQSQGLIVFKYEGDSSTGLMNVLTFWKPVEQTEGLSLSSGLYRLQLADRGSETSITLLDDANKPVLASAVERLHQRLLKYTSVSANVASSSAVPKATVQPEINEKPIHFVKIKDKWIADAPVDRVLSHMSADLSQLGWKVNETNATEQRISVGYEIPEGSIFDALAIWKPLAPNYAGLSSGAYVFQLHQVENGTQIELQTASHQAVPVVTAEQVYQALAKKLLLVNKK
jgi:outer membrane protein assembly factor BamC